MAEPKTEKTDKGKDKNQPKSIHDQWRDARRLLDIKQAEADAAALEEARLADEVARDLLTNHGGASIKCDDVSWKPKKSATRKDIKGEPKPPLFPLMLARESERRLASV
jgi:hypothetical protein